MDSESQKTQVTSDDQDLAKALAGITADADTDTNKPADLNSPASDMPKPTGPVTDNIPMPEPIATPVAPAAPANPATPEPTSQPGGGDLGNIKKDALSELRPLVDKLTLEPQEMFDTYLLLIRSTDDKSLISPAHAAAANIPDETKKAQALLEIIKEIDYLSQ